MPTHELIELEYSHGGQGRLALEHFESEGTSLTPSGFLWDQELGEKCALVQISEDAAYCVPGARDVYAYDTMFADAGCERRVVMSSRPSCGWQPEPVRYIVEHEYAACSFTAIEGIYVAEKLEADAYYEADGAGNCVETPVDPADEYYVAGAKVPPADTFVALKYETDD